MAEPIKNALLHFLETATWNLLRPIDTPVMGHQNKFSVARAPTVPDESEVQVPLNHDFSDTFERE